MKATSTSHLSAEAHVQFTDIGPDDPRLATDILPASVARVIRRGDGRPVAGHGNGSHQVARSRSSCWRAEGDRHDRAHDRWRKVRELGGVQVKVGE
jgi:hypothetical protein